MIDWKMAEDKTRENLKMLAELDRKMRAAGMPVLAWPPILQAAAKVLGVPYGDSSS